MNMIIGYVYSLYVTEGGSTYVSPKLFESIERLSKKQ